MVTEERRRRRGKPKSMASRAAGPTSVRDVPDHLVERILLCLDSSVDLVRAACACKRWHRVVADTGFLAQFRSLRAPPIAGHFHTVDPFYVSKPAKWPIVFLPSPTLTVDRRRFSLDFLPVSEGWKWRLADSRGSLLLVVAEQCNRWKPPTGFYPDLVVCEPLTRHHQFILLPRCLKTSGCLGFFLLDGDGTDDTSGIGMSNFRVVAALHTNSDKPLASVFSSGHNGGWRLPAGENVIVSLPMPTDSINFLGRANGALYWATGDDGAMLVFDEATLEFSEAELPDDTMGTGGRRDCRVIGGGGDGALRVVCVQDNDLKLFVLMPESGEWHVEKTLRLPEATSRLPGHEARYFQYEAMIVAADATHVLVTPSEKTWVFSVELETMEVECRKERNRYAGPAYPYELPWPPALEACAPRGRRRRSCR